MDKCTKIVIGYILAIVLCTVLILSIRVQLSKNVREDFRTDVVEAVIYAFPLIVVGGFFAFALIVLLFTFLIALFEGLFSLGSRAPDQLRSVGTRMRWKPPRGSYASN
jgi:TctA family transporter